MVEPKVQASIDDIEQKVKAKILEVFPVVGTQGSMEVANIEFARPTHLGDYAYEQQLKAKGGSLTGKVYGTITVKDANGKVVSKLDHKLLINIPYKTNRGTFIYGGNEKVIANQLRLKPGVYSYYNKDNTESLLMLKRGLNMKFNFDPETANLRLTIGGMSMPVINFFRILGIPDSDVRLAIGDDKIEEQLFTKAKSSSLSKDARKLYEKLPASRSKGYPGEAESMEYIRSYFFNMAEFGETGKDVMKATIGVSDTALTPEVLLATLSKVVRMTKADTTTERGQLADDMDDLRFQDVLDDADHIQFQVQQGLEDRARELRKLLNSNSKDNLSKITLDHSKLGKNLAAFMSSGQLSDLVEQTNPLELMSSKRKITNLGEGGITDTRAIRMTARNLQNTGFGKLDPIETPESGNIGVVNHLAKYTSIANNTMYAPYFKVTNSTFNEKGASVNLDPTQEFDKYIAFYDPNTFHDVDGKITMPSKVRARFRGEILNAVDSNLINYVDIGPHQIFGDSPSLIPFGFHNDGNRMLMGANMQRQALILKDREVPLVQNAIDKTRTKSYEEAIADKNTFAVKSAVGGTVATVTPNEITVKDSANKVHKHQLYNYFPLNMDHYINNTGIVKPGDKVKAGDLLATGWQTSSVAPTNKGEINTAPALALGKNVRIAYTPWKGYNFEDGYVISRSLANTMVTEEMHNVEVEINEDEIGGPGSNIKAYLLKAGVSPDKVASLDDNGVIKEHAIVGPNTLLVGKVKERPPGGNTAQANIIRALMSSVSSYDDKSEYNAGYVDGEVIRVTIVPINSGGVKTRIIVGILTHNKLKEGDKLAGRHGNKGIITKIEEDEDMPIGEDDKRVDVLYSPLGVPSRKNLGQLLEVSAGLIAEKKGEPFKVFNFDRSEKDRVAAGLKDIGYPDGKMQLRMKNAETGEMENLENKTTVGTAYMMKLKHKVDDKLQGRSFGKTNFVYNIPLKTPGARAGEKENPQKFGEMEMRALQAASAVNIMDEAIQLKGDAAGDWKDRQDILNTLAFNGSPALGRTPQSLKVLQGYTRAMGLNMVPMKDGKELRTLDDDYNRLLLRPMKANEVSRLSSGAVTVPAQFVSYATGDKAEEGGLFDPKIFGEDSKDGPASQWGHIDLAMPMPNPLFMKTGTINPYSILLDRKPKELQQLVGDKFVLVTDPGKSDYTADEIVSYDDADKSKQAGSGIKFEFSGNAFKHMLNKVSVSREMTKALEDIQDKKMNRGQREAAYKRVRVLQMMKDNNLKPEDLLIHKLPVIPVMYRPFVRGAGNRQTSDDLNTLYQHLVNANDRVKNTNFDTFDPSVISKTNKALYETLEHVVGTSTDDKKPSGTGGNKLKGAFDRLGGGGGLVRDKLMSKILDYSGRSVIIGNPALKMDEAGIPVDIVKDIYKPFIMKEIFTKNPMLGKAQVLEKAQNMADPDTWAAMQKAVAERPIILNRAPSLHKFSLRAFTPVITRMHSIELNPLVVKAFNADFDGDSCINSVFMRVVTTPKNGQNVDSQTSACYNKGIEDTLINKEGNKMPFSQTTKVRYNYGVINLGDFPRLELLSQKGNKFVYAVPENIEVLTVWNGEEQWLKVESFSIHKELEMLQVETNTARTIQCSSDHSLVTVDENLDYKRDKASVGVTIPRLRKPIKDGDIEFLWDVSLGEFKEAKYNLKTNKAKLDYKFGYLNGAYIGDGWVNASTVDRSSYGICLASDSDDIPNFIKEVVADYFVEPLHISRVRQPHEFNGKESFCMKHTWYSNTFWNYFHTNIGEGAHNKHLPAFWMHSPASFRWGMLSGLIDTDGSVAICTHNIMINYTTVSRRLAYEVVALAHTLDLTATVTISKTPKGDVCYIVVFTQESVETMRDNLVLQTKYKAERLATFMPNKDYKRNKYTPKLPVSRLEELRKLIGSPRVTTKAGVPMDLTEEQRTQILKRKSLNGVVNRVGKQNTAITRQTALDIFDLDLEIFQTNSFWIKWKAMVMDENIEWELITSISRLPMITEAYDLTIPPAYTMVTEAGFVIYDTMSTHVPLTPKAVDEANKLLRPSVELINPTNGKLVHLVQNEMIVGIYYATMDKYAGKPITKTMSTATYSSDAALMTDYKSARVKTYDIVTVNGVVSTVGQHLFNSIIPEEYRAGNMINGVYRKVYGDKEVKDLITKMLDSKVTNPKAVELMDSLKDFGFYVATKSGMSIGISDLGTPKDKEKIIREADRLTFKNPDSMADNYAKAQSKVQDSLLNTVISDPYNPFRFYTDSGARGKLDQVVRMSGMVGVGMDLSGKVVSSPVKSSHLEGLSPDEFWIHSFDSRRGMADRSLSTAVPGEITRDLYNTTQDVMITMHDCGDRQGYYVSKTTKGLSGRFLAQGIKDDTGKTVLQASTLLDVTALDTIAKIKSAVGMFIRSPITCDAPKGVCQMCYGTIPGTMTIPGIGAPVGIQASQAVGEPTAQGTMRTFHNTGIQKGEQTVAQGLPRLKEILNVTDSPDNKATLSPFTGTVKEVRKDVLNQVISIEYTLLGKTKVKDLKVPLVKKVIVKAGDEVTMGDPLTEGVKDPNEILAFRGLQPTQNYLMEEMDKAMGNMGTDRKHLELITHQLTGKVEVRDPSTSPWLPGQVVQRNSINAWNKENTKNKISVLSTDTMALIGAKAARAYKNTLGVPIVREGQVIDAQIAANLLVNRIRNVDVYPKAIQSDDLVYGLKSYPLKGSENWFSQLGFQNIGRPLSEGAAFGETDSIDEPRSRWMTGKKLNIGAGFGTWLKDEKKDVGTTFSHLLGK